MSEAQHPIGLLRLRLSSGWCSVPLTQVHAVAGYATLTGEADDYFLGWLVFHGEQVPVFDLNRVVCEQATAESFGSRILLVDADEKAPVRLIGLLAGGMTDTVAIDEVGVEPLPLESYLRVLYPLIPESPAVRA